MQLGRQLELEQNKRKEADANFTKAMEELGKAEENEDSPLWAQDRVLRSLDLTIAETKISDDEAGPPAPILLHSTNAIPGQQKLAVALPRPLLLIVLAQCTLLHQTDPVVQANNVAPTYLPFLLLTWTK
ncbi:hypothetical protein RHMOL_Rhmol01G0186600 [Rhododendron molle]|uniref:Uncharacterized protein n=1 Tax=Rhododendron molle TaxID=49168 RepID=A0ACC0Q4C7_RHOML|nr:hypothetical protein RHMOL_Rhmol01G0186600 [Rhododendron molle]